MVRMQAELVAAQKLQAKAAEKADADEDQAASSSSPGVDEEPMRRRALQTQVRAMRHELAKWKHQVDLMEVQKPKEEGEIVKLKAQLTHAADVLDSTRSAARHAEIDRDLAAAGLDREGLAAVTAAAAAASSSVAAWGEAAAKGQQLVPLVNLVKRDIRGTNMEALAERTIRERTEEKNDMLRGKAKRLNNVCGAQQLLIQRLEKQILKEESSFVQKSMQLGHEAQHHAQLQKALRKRSNAAVAEALGLGSKGARAGAAARTASATATSPEQQMAPSGSAGGSMSRCSSAPQLPPIAA